jgi:hypothetical protein
MADQNDVRRICHVSAGNERGKRPLHKETFFTEPHYHGFPAVLVRLSAVNVDELRELITAAWCQAPQCAFLDEGSYRRLRG